MSRNTPLVMGIVNASPDSFSGNSVGGDNAVSLARSMVEAGASVIDIGAQSLRTDQLEIPVDHELDRLLPVLRAVRAALPDVTISVDTYRFEVASAAVEGGAGIINDPSGLSDARVAGLVAASGCQVVLTYNRAVPKQRLKADDFVENVAGDCLTFMRQRLAAASEAGVRPEQVIFDPGVDLGKSPAQTVEILRAMPVLRAELGLHSVLWALSRKDFIGALLERTPRARSAGTFGALGWVDYGPDDLVRVHDVAGTVDFFAVQRALDDGVGAALELPVHLRHEPEA